MSISQPITGRIPEAKTALFIGAGALLGLYWLNWRKNRQNKNMDIPEKWIKVGKVSELIIYPVKSCKGQQLEEAFVTQKGLKVDEFFRDRIFMIVDKNTGSGKNQLSNPKIGTINVDVNSQMKTITLSAPNVENPITFQIPDESTQNFDKKFCKSYDEIYKDRGIDCGNEVSEWLSNFLGKDLCLYLHTLKGESSRELSSKQKKFAGYSPTDKGMFQDETAYMLMSEESLEKLNSNITTPASSRNFRPSIVIKGAPEPFSEDLWSFVKIGKESNGPIFKAAMPCSRCKMTTLNENGEFAKDGEPLKTLTKLKRQIGNSTITKLVRNNAVMGNYLGLIGKDSSEEMKIKVGDDVYAALY